MKYFDATYKVAKQYEIILKDKQLRQIKAWYETKKGDGTIGAELGAKNYAIPMHPGAVRYFKEIGAM